MSFTWEVYNTNSKYDLYDYYIVKATSTPLKTLSITTITLTITIRYQNIQFIDLLQVTLHCVTILYLLFIKCFLRDTFVSRLSLMIKFIFDLRISVYYLSFIMYLSSFRWSVNMSIGIYLDTINIFIRILYLLAGSNNRKRWPNEVFFI